jgi:hypothetical protein
MPVCFTIKYGRISKGVLSEWHGDIACVCGYFPTQQGHGKMGGVPCSWVLHGLLGSDDSERLFWTSSVSFLRLPGGFVFRDAA